jgi:uncharacterized protein (TIGR03083 family)
MEVAEHIAALRGEGELLADVAARLDLDAPVPTCPEWQVRDLIRHVGGVHRWATAHVVQRRATPIDAQEQTALMEAWPEDGALIDWFREGLVTLVRALETAAPDLACWAFLPAPTPLAFWARRQAHETAIHRVDVERAGASAITAFPPAFAADGIDEILFGFVSRPRGRLRAETPRTLLCHAPDAKRHWLVCIGPGPVQVRNEVAPADCVVRGSASDLYLLLWNRGATDALEVDGDAALLDQWRESVRIRWG